MKKTVEQLTKEFAEIMAANGFEATNETDYAGNILYSRRWERTDDVLWHGPYHTTYEIVASISYGYPMIRMYEDGRQIDRRDYSSPKRALNAMKEIIRCAGYEF